MHMSSAVDMELTILQDTDRANHDEDETESHQLKICRT